MRNFQHQLGLRIDHAIEATPVWVFLVLPRLVGSVLVWGCLFYAGHLAFGISMNPFANLHEVLKILHSNR